MLGEMQPLGRDLLTTNFFTGKTGRLALVFLAGMACIHVASWWVISQRLPLGYQDFTIFYTAGRILSQGQGAQLYDNALQYRTQQAFAPYTAIRKGPLPYNHIPVEAVIFVPFSKLPYFQAYVLWNLFNVLLLAGALQILRPHLAALRSQSLLFGVLLGLASFPVFIALIQGQDILLLLLLLALTYSALRRNASFAAGCWLGLGLFRFTLVLPVVLILAWRRAWKLLGGFALSSAFLAAASAALVGWKTTLLYPAYVLRVENRWVGPATSRDMPNLRGLIETALTGIVEPRIFVSIIVVLSLALLWFCASRFDWNSHDPRFDLSFSLALVAAVLASYHAYSHDLSILLIPVLLVANHCRARWVTARVWAMVAPMSVLFLTPLCVFLLFRMKLACLLAIPVLIWFWGIAREISGLSDPVEA